MVTTTALHAGTYSVSQHRVGAQVILLATVALAVASLSSIAVPKLAGDLIDICISYGQKSFDEPTAKHKLDGKLTC